MMKIRRVLKLVYWLIFQDGIEELQNKIKEIEIIQSAEMVNRDILITRVTILEKQIQKLMDGQVFVRVHNFL